MHKLSDFLCILISGILWAAGLCLSITGKFLPGTAFIILAFLCSPKRIAPFFHKVFKKEKTNRSFRTLVNLLIILVLILGATGFSVFGFRKAHDKDRYTESAEDSTSTTERMSVKTEDTGTGEEITPGDTPKISISIPEPPSITLDDLDVLGLRKDYKDFIASLGKKKESPAQEEESSLEPAKDPVQDSNQQEQVEQIPNNTGITGLEIDFLDVGQADCTLIICNNEAMLIDAGTEDQGTKIRKVLKEKGISTLQYCILTHNDADHIGSADSIISNFTIGDLFISSTGKPTYSYDRMMEAIEYYNLTWSQPAVGSTYSLDEAKFTILAPSAQYEDSNDNSIVLKLTYKDRSFLFLGDAEKEEIAELMSSDFDLAADVLKAGHHGSSTSSPKELINAINPSFAVISCGAGNEYHHPHPSVLNTFKKAAIEVFRTDEQGTISLTSDGSSIIWNTEPSTTWEPGS